MIHKPIFLFLLTTLQLSFSKSSFRVCSTKEPCDKDFYCDLFVLFCAPCRDICIGRFIKLCQQKCSDSKYMKNIDPKTTSTTHQIEATLYIFKNAKPVIESAEWSTTPLTRNKQKNYETEGTSDGNVPLETGPVRFGFGTISKKHLVLWICLLGICITIIYFLYRWGSQQRRNFTNCFTTEIIEKKTTHTASCPWSRNCKCETSNSNAKLLNSKVNFVMDDTV